jgi:hypothetical protein
MECVWGNWAVSRRVISFDKFLVLLRASLALGYTVDLGYTGLGYNGSFFIPRPFPYALSQELPQLHWPLI